MSTITLKNVPPAVHKALKSCAKAHGRSLNREIIHTLEEHFHAAPIKADTTGQSARVVRETLGIYLTEKDLAALKKEGRK